MFMKQPYLLILICTICFCPAWCNAATIQTSGEYTIGDGETMSAGIDHARNDAIRQAAEQAGALVRSFTKVRDMQLEEDVIEVVANHAMRITTMPAQREMVGNAVRIRVNIRAELIEGEIEQAIMRMLGQQTELKDFQQLKQKLEQQSRELEALKKQLAQAGDSAKQQIISRIGENERQMRAASLMQEAGRLASLKQFDEARELMDQAVTLDPSNPRAYLRRTLVSFKPAEQEGVRQDIAAAIRLDPAEGPLMANSACLQRASVYLESGNQSAALAEADRAVAILGSTVPPEHRAFLQFVRKSYGIHDDNKLVRLLCDTFAISDCTQQGVKKSEKARAMMQHRRLLPHLYDAYRQRAWMRYEAGDLNGARRDREMSCAAYNMGRGMTMYMYGDFCEKSGEFKSLSTPAQLRAYQMVQQGIRASSARATKLALERFDAATRLDPGCADAWFQRGFLHLTLDHHNQALDDFEQLVRLEPASARSYHYRAMAKERLKDYIGALKDLEKAMKLAPHDSELLRKRAITYEMLNQPDKAAADYISYARSNAGSPVIMLQTARELMRMGRTQEERQLLEALMQAVKEVAKDQPVDQEFADEIAKARERLELLKKRP